MLYLSSHALAGAKAAPAFSAVREQNLKCQNASCHFHQRFIISSVLTTTIVHCKP